MNWRKIEQAILTYASAMGIREDHIDRSPDDTTIDIRAPVNISELARAIDKAITVRVD
jgi:hypothetical protein